VPIGTPIRANSCNGNTHIGDTEGLLQFSSSGPGDLHVGRVSNTALRMRGSSNFRLKEVNGNLDIRLSGSGDISVNCDHISHLEVKLSGSGDIHVNSSAESAHLDWKVLAIFTSLMSRVDRVRIAPVAGASESVTGKSAEDHGLWDCVLAPLPKARPWAGSSAGPRKGDPARHPLPAGPTSPPTWSTMNGMSVAADACGRPDATSSLSSTMAWSATRPAPTRQMLCGAPTSRICRRGAFSMGSAGAARAGACSIPNQR
jgi:hypothetical protein